MNASTPLCAPTADAAFGPAIGSTACRDGFDFTLVFEQSIFVILPASLLLLAAPLRLIQLSRSSAKVAGHGLRLIKLAATGGFAALQLALIILWATRTGSHRLNSISLAAACVSFASSLMSCALSYAEHVKSPRPSSLLNVFLLVSLVLEAALLRTLWLSPIISSSIRGVFTASFAVKAALLVLEAWDKSRDLVVEPGRVYAPEETAGLYARAVFAWVAPLLRTGFGRLLQPADLFALDEDMTASVLSQRFWWHWNKAPPSPTQSYGLLICCIVTLRTSLIAVVVPRLILLAFTICQPLVLNKFLIFLDDASQSVNVGYGLIAAYGLVYFGIAVSEALYWHSNGRFVTMLRGVLVSAIFSKTTELSITATDNAAAVTLMSSDVEVIGRAVRQINEFWANLVQIAIGTWLLSSHIGYAAAGPIVVSLVALMATVAISPFAKKYQVGWLAKTQKRVGITSAMIGHIKSIKMSGLSQKLADTISALRLDEIAASRPFRTMGSITSSIAQVPLLLSPPVAFAMFQGVAAKTGETLDATRMFASLSFIILLAQPLFWMFEVVLDLSAAMGAFDRIQKHLVGATREEYREVDTSVVQGRTSTQDETRSIEMQHLRKRGASSGIGGTNSTESVGVSNGRFSWSQDRVVLDDINFTLPRGQFAMLVGPVASGKSTLLKGLLGEVPHVTGRISLASSKLSWCDQSPWILNQTVRDNIIGYSTIDQALYDRVVKACELEKDIKQLPQGDMTKVGSKGLALSGGQKQRIALARAIYARPQIALFDDIFSGLDNHTAHRVFKNLFSTGGLLRQWGTTIILVTQTVGFFSSADLIITLNREGRISEQGTFEHLRTSGTYIKSLLSNKEYAAASELDITPEPEEIDESPKTEYKAKEAKVQDDKRRQIGDSTVYRYYFGSIGLTFVVTLFALEIGWAFLGSFPTVWLKFWTDANQDGSNDKAGYYLGIYSAFQVIGVIWFAVLIWFVLLRVAAKSGISLHQRLLVAVVKAPLSLFTTTDLGSITTRFSQDIGMVDKNLPLALVVTLASFFTVIAKAGLLASSSYYVAISFPFLGILYFYLQRGYLRTSRQLRFLDLEEKAPVYTQFLETLSGLSTIRAFGWANAAIETNHQLVDRSQKPFYLLIMVQRWLVLVLDLTTTALALLIVGFAVKLRGSVSVGLTGVSLVQLISLSETLNMLIQFWTSIETSIGAVARIKQFAEETPEESLPGETQEPPADWPSQGHVVINDLTATYGEEGDSKALDEISLEIKPGEKVGICGRTGSGKSSLLLSILRLLDPSSGTLSIDSIPLYSLHRETIRSRLIAVTQDQFVLPGSVRQNIDPFDASITDDIISALDAVGLWATIEGRGGLDIPFGEDMLSHGQKQLFSLGRAVLRKDAGKLLLLDEATSSVDRETEEMVRKVIDTEFKEHSVLAIAHRLDTVINFDRVVVLDQGRIAEVGQPQDLLRSGGMFKALWDASHRNASPRA